VAVVLETFETHLAEICGASPGTRRCYLQHVRFFLRARFGEGPVDLTRIVSTDLVKYISDYAARVKRRTAKKAACALRSFLRSLQLQGLSSAGLVAAVPSIRSWKLSDIPKLLSEEQVRRLLTSFDCSSRQGRRDYAMTLLMARLGLRAGEVAGISLDDIDWRGGTLRIEGGKRRRSHVLPLPADVGRAVVAYLKHGRPQSSQRRLFLRHRPPVGEPICSGTVGAVIRRAHERAHLKAAAKGTHALRHTLATRLLRGGANLKEIADILGHRSIDTTAIYAKVDLARLSTVGLPWPEACS
jgi:site-specific recombinase XerD